MRVLLDRDEARQRYESGESAPAIAAEMGFAKSTVLMALKDMGVPMRSRWDYSRPDPDDEGFFWDRVDKVSSPDGCWLWTGRKTRDGYGETRVGDDRRVRAHRYSYELACGPIPEGLIICHHCDNPPCVNPDHLFPGTHKDNAEDRNGKGRHQFGENHWKARLSAERVQAIRERYARGNVTQARLAQDHGVSLSTVHVIVHNKRWKRVGA